MTSIKKSKAILAALICNGFWGLSFMASRTALKEASVFLVLSHSFVLAFLVMTLLFFTSLGKGSLRGKPLLPLILLGLFQPATAVSVFAGAVFLHEPFSFPGMVCCLLILLGIYGVNAAGSGSE